MIWRQSLWYPESHSHKYRCTLNTPLQCICNEWFEHLDELCLVCFLHGHLFPCISNGSIATLILHGCEEGDQSSYSVILRFCVVYKYTHALSSSHI